MAVDFNYTKHPRVEERAQQGPITTTAVRLHVAERGIRAFNARIGLAVTNAVGTMWAAYVFALISLMSLPAVLVGVLPSWRQHFPHWIISASLISLVGWISSYFLQLVLLPIIIVGQNIQATAADQRADATYRDAEAVLHESEQIQNHLKAQDAEIERLLHLVRSLEERWIKNIEPALPKEKNDQ